MPLPVTNTVRSTAMTNSETPQHSNLKHDSLAASMIPLDPEEFETEDTEQLFMDEHCSVDAAGKKKRKKKKKKKKSKGKSDEILPSLDRDKLLNYERRQRLAANFSSTSSARMARKVNDEIWTSLTDHEELQKIRKFWMGLSEKERQSLIQVEKEAVLSKLKERQKRACNCSVCGKKSIAVEDQLEEMYHSFCEELQQDTNQNKPQSSTQPSPPQRQAQRQQAQVNGSHHSSLKAMASQHHHYDQEFHQELKENIMEEDGDDEEDDEDDNGSCASDPSDTRSDISEHYDDAIPYSVQNQVARTSTSDSGDYFNFRNTLAVKGGILTVADDLLKNNGKKFLDMMEMLAERSIQKEEEIGLEQGEDYFDDEDEDDDEDLDDIDEDESAEQRREGSRDLFYIIATRMFAQRVLAAFREFVARERQQLLIQELEEEERLQEEKEKKKKRDKEKKKDRKRQLKKQKEEEQLALEAQRQAEEAAVQAEKEQKAELERQKREKERRRKEEERLRKEAERQKQIQEEMQRKQKEREEREAQELREREEREKREQQERERQERTQREREQREREQRELERQEREKLEREREREREQEQKEKEEREAQELLERQGRQEEQERQRRLLESLNYADRSGNASHLAHASLPALHQSPHVARSPTTLLPSPMMVLTPVPPMVDRSGLSSSSGVSLGFQPSPLVQGYTSSPLKSANPLDMLDVASSSPTAPLLPSTFTGPRLDGESALAAPVSRPTFGLYPMGPPLASRPIQAGGVGPVGSPIGTKSANKLNADRLSNAFAPATENSFFSHFPFGDDNNTSKRRSGREPSRERDDGFMDPIQQRPLPASSGPRNWVNGWTANSVFSDHVHGKLFGDVLSDTLPPVSLTLLDRAKMAYYKLEELQGPSSFYALMDLCHIMCDLYRDEPTDLRELYEMLRTPASGFQCLEHPQHGIMVRYDAMAAAADDPVRRTSLNPAATGIPKSFSPPFAPRSLPTSMPFGSPSVPVQSAIPPLPLSSAAATRATPSQSLSPDPSHHLPPTYAGRQNSNHSTLYGGI